MAGYSPHVGENLVAQKGLSTSTLGISVLSAVFSSVTWPYVHCTLDGVAS